MSFVEQLSQLIVVVAILILAYFGVMIWTRRLGKNGGSIFGGGGSEPAKLDLSDDSDMSIEMPKRGSNRNKGRFNLQGKDAEVAARVLKRMLKQGGGSEE